MLISAGATVTVCHSGTRDIPQITRSAEIIFVATGRPHHFRREYFRDRQVIIDAGIGFIGDKLAGDVDIAALADLDVQVTPVPGGVGPLTSVLILENLLKLIENRNGKAPTRRQTPSSKSGFSNAEGTVL